MPQRHDSWYGYKHPGCWPICPWVMPSRVPDQPIFSDLGDGGSMHELERTGSCLAL
jgi:hypothetical protein